MHYDALPYRNALRFPSLSDLFMTSVERQDTKHKPIYKLTCHIFEILHILKNTDTKLYPPKKIFNCTANLFIKNIYDIIYTF